MKQIFTHRRTCVTLSFLCVFSSGYIKAQDNCSTAVLLPSSTACTNTTGTVVGASYGGDLPVTCGTPRYDVWYKFVAQTASPVITLSSIGVNFTNPKIQLLSGTCGSFSNVACSILSGSNQVINATGLTIGATYYVRVFSTATSGSAPSSSGGFSICVKDPAPSTIETSRAYINVSKGTTGGTVDYSIRWNFAPRLSSRATLPTASLSWIRFTTVKAFASCRALFVCAPTKEKFTRLIPMPWTATPVIAIKTD